MDRIEIVAGHFHRQEIDRDEMRSPMQQLKHRVLLRSHAPT
jgi:hypothetical protein